MEKRILGKTQLSVSVLGFGASEIGSHKTPITKVERLILTAQENGCNVIDTAECYHQSEESIGHALKNFRSEFYLFTKVGHTGWGFDDVTKCIERSLFRLQTDYLDLVLLHGCSHAILNQGDAFAALDQAKTMGKIRFIGYSGDGDRASRVVQQNIFDVLEISANICDQFCIENTIPLASAKGIGIIAKRPIANIAWRYNTTPQNPYLIPYWERLQKLSFDFTQYPNNDIDTALRFTLSIPGVSTIILGSTSPEHFKDDIDIINKGSLDNELFNSIRKRWQQIADPNWYGLD